jgi:hypothetical protein
MRAFRLVLAVSMAAVGMAATGCADPACVPATMTVAPASAPQPYGHLVLTATLKSADGKPLAGMPLDFSFTVIGPEIPKNDNFTATAGKATTDSTGVARVDLAQGIFGSVLPGDTVTGYTVGYSGIKDPNRIAVCGDIAIAKSAPVRCEGSAVCGPAPPLQQGIG